MGIKVKRYNHHIVIIAISIYFFNVSQVLQAGQLRCACRLPSRQFATENEDVEDMFDPKGKEYSKKFNVYHTR